MDPNIQTVVWLGDVELFFKSNDRFLLKKKDFWLFILHLASEFTLLILNICFI